MKPVTATYFTLVGAQDFKVRTTRLRYQEAHKALRLSRHETLRLPQTDQAQAALLLENHQPALVDGHHELAWIAADGKSLLQGQRIDDASGVIVQAGAVHDSATSAEALELAPVVAPGDAQFTALAMWGRHIALGWSDAVLNVHGVDVVVLGTRQHYRLDTLPEKPEQVWLDARQQVWIVDSAQQLHRCAGQPLPQAWTPQADAFQPLQANLHPFQLAQSLALPAGEAVLALCSDETSLFLLRPGELLQYDMAAPERDPQSYTLDENLPYVSDCRVLAPGRLALWSPVELGQRRAEQDCPVVTLDKESAEAPLVMERYPRRRLDHNAFLADANGGVAYLSDARVLTLSRLPQARYHKRAVSILRKKLDSEITDTLWDRIVIEACIPAATEIRLHLRAYDRRGERGDRAWHDQGMAVASTIPVKTGAAGASSWEWVIRKTPNTGAVREIRGRYLEIKLEFRSNGLATPQLFAMQVWYPRLSWQQQYLPEFMHQVEMPEEGSVALANGADVRERMLSALAAMQDTVAQQIDHAETLIDPLTAPEALLPQLSRMLGERPPAFWPVQRQRHWLSQAGELQRWRGTFRGLCLALDIATDGAVSLGRVIPVEDFRLRRPLFCALGVDFAARSHPLTLDTVQSGNSIVGDTLTLGPDDAETLLRLLLPEAAAGRSVRQLLDDYADTHAWRISLILHADAADYQGVIEDLLRVELPAHLRLRILASDHSFVPGLAPLLGIHTYLQPFAQWRRLVLDQHRIGGAAVLQNLPVLSPGRVDAPMNNGENP